MSDLPRPKRRVKSPETFRERALKATEETGSKKPGSMLSNWLKSGFKPVGHAFRVLGTRTPLVYPIRGVRLVLRYVVPSYLKNSWRELKLVTWPGWRQSRGLTLAVLIFAIVFGGAVALVDSGLDHLFKAFIIK